MESGTSANDHGNLTAQEYADFLKLCDEVLEDPLRTLKTNLPPYKVEEYLRLRALHGTAFLEPMSSEDATRYADCLLTIRDSERTELPSHEVFEVLREIDERYGTTMKTSEPGF